MLFIFIVCCLLKDLFVFHFVRFVFATFIFDTIYIHICVYIYGGLISSSSVKCLSNSRVVEVDPKSFDIWGWVKTLVPSEPQNSWDVWMFIPLKMYL